MIKHVYNVYINDYHSKAILEKLYEVMKYGNSAKFGGEIELSESLIIKARQPLVKMLEMS